jgi:adenylate cyclase
VPECEVGAGVAAGVAIAGNVGTRERFEYTVIGDPVNEAARLADLAKERSGLLASGKVVEAAARSAALDWTYQSETRLRGRDEATRVFVPRDPGTRAGRP